MLMPSYPKLPLALVDQALIVNVEVRGALVKEKNAGLSIQGSREEHSLLLTSRKRAAHVANEAVVGHGHGHDLVVDRGKPGALKQLVLIVVGIEETDIVV